MNLFRPPREPAEALLWRTRLRLALVTLVMVATLVVLVGLTTAAAATALMRESIDRALDAAVSDSLTLHELLDSEAPYTYRGPLGRADTFVMLVDSDGKVYGNTTNSELDGLPDMAAIDAAATGADRRSGTYGEASVRLLTIPYRTAQVEDEEEGGAGSNRPLYLQAGHDLTLQHEFEEQLTLVIGLIALLGIIGAVLVTLFITNRALVPIRMAFATERRFVATASHELRTPIAIIRASAEIIDREDLVAEPGRPLVEDIVGETERMGTLVSDLMALASAQAGALHIELAEIELAGYLLDIGRRSRSIAQRQGLHFQMETAVPATTRIRADRDRLDQLLLILMDNAINHSPPGGTVYLDARLEARSRRVIITVSDEGPGIEPADAQRIFEPFARAGQGATSSSGTGLGLAIARQLADLHGAELTVEGRPGPGATFSLRLPLLQ